MAFDDDEGAEIARMLAMTREELRAHITARGFDWETEVARLDPLAQAEMMEKELFGATLDDIMNFSDLADLEIRPVGSVRKNQEPNSAGLEPARPRRADPTQARDTLIPLPRAMKENSDVKRTFRDGDGGE
jgi:hypothetical protein